MPSMYIHEKYIDWLTLSDTGMHTEASKKPGKRTGAAWDRLNMVLKADVTDMKQAISQGLPHQAQAAVQARDTFWPTVSHNDRR